jgi:hypothetical protein
MTFLNSFRKLTEAHLALGAVVSASVFACGKPAEAPPQAEPAATSADVDAPAPASAGKRKNFHEMEHAEKLGYMKNTVMPEMKALWAGAGQKVDDFSCKTCHGSGADSGSFKMPSDSLPKLDVSDGFADEKKAHPEAVQFMMEKVVPAMAALVDEEPYNPETHQGFGCFECHTKAEPGATPAAH